MSIMSNPVINTLTAPLNLIVVFLFGVQLLCMAKGSANTNVNFSVTVIDPPPCVFNNGNDVSVDFGDEVLITRVDGVNYSQPVPYNLTCSPAPPSNDLKLQFMGSSAGFDSALATSNDGLGIKLMQGGVVVPINTWLNFTWPSTPIINAVLVKRPGSNLSPGLFTGVATLMVQYQ